jgi:hypothetical protein
VIPVGLGLAVLRYRLYDIDRLVSRTVGYAAVTAIVIGLYAGVVVTAQVLLGPTDAFSHRLRDQVDLDQLVGELHDTVHRTMAPATVTVWVSPDVRT